MTRRIERICKVIKEDFGKIFMEELDLPRDILLTVTKAEISKDLSVCKIWISIFPFAKKDEVFGMITKDKKDLRRIFGKMINLRITPEVIFYLDEGEEKGDKIDRLLAEIKNNGKTKNKI